MEKFQAISLIILTILVLSTAAQAQSVLGNSNTGQMTTGGDAEAQRVLDQLSGLE